MQEAYPHELSGGQRQRVLLARAFLLHSQLVVADEPTSALDAVTQREILRLFEDICAGGSAVLFITHTPSILNGLAKEIVQVSSGPDRIAASGCGRFCVSSLILAQNVRKKRMFLAVFLAKYGNPFCEAWTCESRRANGLSWPESQDAARQRWLAFWRAWMNRTVEDVRLNDQPATATDLQNQVCWIPQGPGAQPESAFHRA